MNTPLSDQPTGSPTFTYLGVGVGLAGFLLILWAWGMVSGAEDVDDQLAPLVGAGFTGVCAVMVGVALVNIAAKQADQRVRARQLDRLAALVEELHRRDDEDGS